MIRVNLTVHYRDGSTVETCATQYALAQYGLYCARQGLPQPELGTERAVVLADMHALRYWAWVELMRDAAQKVSFEAWDRTVEEVAAPQQPAADVDPTPPVTPGG